jgi:hypothetical protein
MNLKLAYLSLYRGGQVCKQFTAAVTFFVYGSFNRDGFYNY